MPDEVITHLDRGNDSAGTRALLEVFGLQGEIARKGVAAPGPGRQAVGGGTDPRVDEQLRQTSALH
jgi:hypothetical protein